jgi:hypothetical protein
VMCGKSYHRLVKYADVPIRAKAWIHNWNMFSSYAIPVFSSSRIFGFRCAKVWIRTETTCSVLMPSPCFRRLVLIQNMFGFYAISVISSSVLSSSAPSSSDVSAYLEVDRTYLPYINSFERAILEEIMNQFDQNSMY